MELKEANGQVETKAEHHPAGRKKSAAQGNKAKAEMPNTSECNDSVTTLTLNSFLEILLKLKEILGKPTEK